MILPIAAYSLPVLRQHCAALTPTYENLNQLIANMWETLDHADGVGLAAPQVNHPIQLFIVDSLKTYTGPLTECPGIRKVFINPDIRHYSKETNKEEEGCLSIPGIYAPIERASTIEIHYLDEYFHPHTAIYQGRTARMIQHEYDHIKGKLYLDYLSPLQKALLKNKLEKIRKGKTRAPYELLCP